MRELLRDTTTRQFPARESSAGGKGRKMKSHLYLAYVSTDIAEKQWGVGRKRKKKMAASEIVSLVKEKVVF